MERKHKVAGLVFGVSVGLITISLGPLIAGVATTMWTQVSYTEIGFTIIGLHVGLFQICVPRLDSICFDINEDTLKVANLTTSASTVLAQVKACEALAIIGVVSAGFTFLTLFFYMCMPKCGKPRRAGVLFGVGVLAIITCASITICLIIWGAGVQSSFSDSGQENSLDFAFFLCMAGDILISIGGVVVLLAAARIHKTLVFYEEANRG